MVNDILTPMNHREIEYHARKLPGLMIPGSRIDTDPALQEGEGQHLLESRSALLKWLDETGARVFDDDLVMDYGTDCLRLYLLFEQTPKENDAPCYDSWQEGALEGIYKFLGRYRRMILAADVWNRWGRYNEETLSAEHVRMLRTALRAADAKIAKCICRGNTMSNRHNIVAALMELLNIFQKELRTGEIVTALHTRAVETAVPHSGFGSGENPRLELQDAGNPDVAELCEDFIIAMAPYAPDLSKVLWLEIGKK